MLLGILRFLRGYVAFSVSGKYPERFLNIASRRRVRLWDVRRGEEGFTACMYRADYLRIRPLARGAGVKLRLAQKRGLPEYARRYRDRVGILLGGGAFILTVFVMSLFIWSIDITGLDTVSRSQMQAALREQGLYVGAFKPGLDYQQIARSIMLEHHEIGWMAVNVTGSYASVEVKEEAPAPEVADIYAPCNIKASTDGQILRIEAAQGETMLTEGSGVIGGQLVVSGVMGDEESGYRLVHADARVIARTIRRASFSVPDVSASLIPNGEFVERKSLMLFGVAIPFWWGAVDSPYSVADARTESPAPLGITLPVGIRTERVSALEKIEEQLDENSAEELLQREATLYEAFFLQNCTVEKRDFSLRESDGTYTLDVIYTCVEDIAYAEPIGVEEVE